MDLVFCCSPDNDLYRILSAHFDALPRCDTFSDALDLVPEEGAILALADDYPRPLLSLSVADLERANNKRLRLFLEYPAHLPGLNLGEPQSTEWERAVVASDFFSPALEKERILALHGCWHLPVEVEEAHLSVSRIAGYHRAVYGIPDNSAPLLFEWSAGNALVATTALSCFVTARYAPTSAWKTIWQRLLHWLLPAADLPVLSWQPSVGLTAAAAEALPADSERRAFIRSTSFFRDHVLYSIDWKKGAHEGFEAGIDHRGRQLRRAWVRADCTAESALVFAHDAQLSGDPSSRLRAGQLLDYVFSAPDFFHDDPADPAWGLVNWFERGPAYYGDDNARVLLAAMGSAQLLNDGRWDERILRCLLGNLRTTGPQGFRQRRIDQHHFNERGGWTAFRDTEHIHHAPHYQAYLWAAFLWAHELTGHQPFLELPRRAIRATVEAYPNGWQWTNGLAQEIARLLLPLAFLVRVDDTPEHRAWLRQMADELLALMPPCGAVRETLGAHGLGAYGPPESNEAYGTREATLVQEEGDPVCDLLYTTNFAFLGLHEAAAATGWSDLDEAADQLADFLCRIQVVSQAQPYLNGAWMRSFDYELWEYWGSSADLGWGAWCVETGWTNTWIASVLAMRQRQATLFDTALKARFTVLFPNLLREMTDSKTGSVIEVGGDVLQAPGSE